MKARERLKIPESGDYFALLVGMESTFILAISRYWLRLLGLQGYMLIVKSLVLGAHNTLLNHTTSKCNVSKTNSSNLVEKFFIREAPRFKRSAPSLSLGARNKIRSTNGGRCRVR